MSIIASGAGLLLSSCSRLENISVSKRHYRSGFYVDLGSRKQDVAAPRISEPVASVTASSASSNVEDQSSMSPEKEIQTPTPLVLANHADKKKQTYKPAIGNLYASNRNISAMKEEIREVSLSNHIASLKDVNYTAKPSSSSDSASMWAIILFAIIIPPVGVALKFGIVDKFWISLVLTLLFWLPGAIYSVIVVTQK